MACLAAGLLAGLVLGLFILLVLGPLIDQAEAMEGEENPVPVAERRAAAFGAALVIGIVVGIPFALVFPLISAILPWRSLLSKAWVHGLLALAVFSVLPLLAVPGTPPGVEISLDVAEAELWYVGTILFALGGVLAAFGLYYLLSRKARSPWGTRGSVGLSLSVGALLWILPFLLRPEIEIVPGNVSPELIRTFYYLTLLEWTVFWLVLSTALGRLWPRFQVRALASASEVPA